MQLVAINWHVYLITKSPLALGGVVLCASCPSSSARSLEGGCRRLRPKALDARNTRSDVDQRRIACVLTASGLSRVWPIYLLTAIASAAIAFDNPARQAMLPTLVPKKDFPNAVSLGILVFNSAMIVGPALAGLLLKIRGPALIYGLNAASFVASSSLCC